MIIKAINFRKLKKPIFAMIILLSAVIMIYLLRLLYGCFFPGGAYSLGSKESGNPKEFKESGENTALVFSGADYSYGIGWDAFVEMLEEEPPEDGFLPDFSNVNRLSTFVELQKYLFTIDKSAYVTAEDLDIKKLLAVDLRTELHGDKPKILIFHTHSQEDFVDSEAGRLDDTIVGVGKFLAEILVEKYNIPVVHDVGKYDFENGRLNRENSYGNMEPAVKKLLEKYPDVEIAIDLHRDALPDNSKLLTVIDGKPTAKIMFFNGITKINDGGKPKELKELVNPYLAENLALSLRMKLTANEMYPDFTRKIYIKPYRYSLHMLEKSMLVEVGSNTNTVEEAKNAMYPLAEIIVKVFEDL